jgi:hypothetical protein
MAVKRESDAKIIGTATNNLIEMLGNLPGLRYKRQHKSWEVDSDGRYVVIASWGPDRPQVELWFDRATGGGRFWFGFSSESEERIRNLIDQLPDDVAPKGEPYTEEDWKRDPRSRRYAFRSPKESELSRPFWEKYETYNAFYFGMYDWGGHATQNALYFDTWRAAAFITKVVESVSSDDMELTAFEGAARKLFVQHRRREAKLRAKKIRQARLKNRGRLIGEVPNCGFDFVQKYGELGEGYAHVHHKKQLSEAGKGIEVKLEDLAIVCANCHAMIHLGGECRSMGSLIPHSGNKL